jgi:hypothetical protein
MPEILKLRKRNTLLPIECVDYIYIYEIRITYAGIVCLLHFSSKIGFRSPHTSVGRPELIFQGGVAGSDSNNSLTQAIDLQVARIGMTPRESLHGPACITINCLFLTQLIVE